MKTKPFNLFNPLLLAPIALSMVVLVHHFYRVNTQGLSMWKGGGMGMFSNSDTPGTRRVKIQLIDDTLVYVVNVSSVSHLTKEYRSLPTRDRLQQLCQDLGGITWEMASKMVISDRINPWESPVIMASARDRVSHDDNEVITFQRIRVEGLKVVPRMRADELVVTSLGVVEYEVENGRCSIQ